MAKTALTGTRVRARRLDLGLRQADLAKAVGISASYLNLIEHNRRRIGGKVLGDLAAALQIDPANLTEGADSTLVQGLREVAGAFQPLLGRRPELGQTDEPFAGLSHAQPRPATLPTPPEPSEDLADRFPGWAAQVVVQHRRIADLEATVATLSDRMSHDPHLAAALHDILSSVTAIRSTSSILTGDQQPDPAWQTRFQRNIHEESARLAQASQSLAGYLDRAAEAGPGTATPQEELEAWLAARDWHLPELEEPAPDIAALADTAGFKTPQARDFAQDWLQRAHQLARVLPLDRLADDLAEGWPEPSALAHRFDVPVAHVLRRLAALPPSLSPSPVGLLSSDGAGALVFRRPIDGFPLPRIGAGCPLWPLYEALRRPDQPRAATVELPEALTRRFHVYAAAETRVPGTFAQPAVIEATMLILPHRTAAEGPARLVGSACRVCPRAACAARREPSILALTRDSF